MKRRLWIILKSAGAALGVMSIAALVIGAIMYTAFHTTTRQYFIGYAVLIVVAIFAGMFVSFFAKFSERAK